jgi:hypothetical protein
MRVSVIFAVFLGVQLEANAAKIEIDPSEDLTYSKVACESIERFASSTYLERIKGDSFYISMRALIDAAAEKEVGMPSRTLSPLLADEIFSVYAEPSVSYEKLGPYINERKKRCDRMVGQALWERL